MGSVRPHWRWCLYAHSGGRGTRFCRKISSRAAIIFEHLRELIIIFNAIFLTFLSVLYPLVETDSGSSGLYFIINYFEM